DPGGAQADEAGALLLEGRHALTVAQVGGGAHVEVDPVLGGLALGHPLEEEAGPGAVRVLERRGTVVLVAGETAAFEELVPCRERIRPRFQRDPGWGRVLVPQDLLPEDGQGARVLGIDRDLDGAAHWNPPSSWWSSSDGRHRTGARPCVQATGAGG